MLWYLKGLSVVDYCLISHESLSSFCEFEIIHTSELISQSGLVGAVAPTGIPDHSLLVWSINFDQCCFENSEDETFGNEQTFDKFDLSTVSTDFLSGTNDLFRVSQAVAKLEQSFRTQRDIDAAFNDWCGIIKEKMYERLPYKTIKIGVDNKRRKIGKPWWSDRLIDLWNDACIAERFWLGCREKHTKSVYKSNYITKRKLFDREVQHAKRIYWYRTQIDMARECNLQDNSFWKTIGKLVVSQCRKQQIPMEVVLEDGSISTKHLDILNKWKNDFSSLLNGGITDADSNIVLQPTSVNEQTDPCFNEHISFFEVKKAIFNAKKGKACGFDNIPSEVLQNDMSVSFLHILFNICFDTGVIPSDWGKCVINPIPKSCTSDRRDPLSYRGIALAPSMYKIYCFILNERLSNWSEQNGKIIDEQNGFRKKCSTVDHLSSLTSLIDTRRKRKLSTYCAFIDFRKAYDCINRDILWGRLSSIGVSGKLFGAIKSLYSSISSCVRISHLTTDWFNVSSGLRQGCCLSPLLFHLFINEVALQIKSLGKGVQVGNDIVSILLYADDVVPLPDNPTDIQLMIDSLLDWCNTNGMAINSKKSNVVHFRPNSEPRSNFEFSCGTKKLAAADRYSYLGITLTEFLDFDATAKIIAQSASRALGLLIAKYKNMGGMPYDVFTKLYESTVWPIISYGAAVRGFKSYSCINAVQNRAMRFLIGTGKYTPTAAVFGDYGLETRWN